MEQRSSDLFIVKCYDLYFKFHKFKMSLLLNILYITYVFVYNINIQVSTTVYGKLKKYSIFLLINADWFDLHNDSVKCQMKEYPREYGINKSETLKVMIFIAEQNCPISKWNASKITLTLQWNLKIKVSSSAKPNQEGFMDSNKILDFSFMKEYVQSQWQIRIQRILGCLGMCTKFSTYRFIKTLYLT